MTFDTIEPVQPSNFDPLELFQLLPTGDIVSLGGTASAEMQVVQTLENYPGMGVHVFYARRVLAPCNPPEEELGFRWPRDWGTTAGHTDMHS